MITLLNVCFNADADLSTYQVFLFNMMNVVVIPIPSIKENLNLTEL